MIDSTVDFVAPNPHDPSRKSPLSHEIEGLEVGGQIKGYEGCEIVVCFYGFGIDFKSQIRII